MMQLDPRAPRIKLSMGKYPVTDVSRLPFGPGCRVTIRVEVVSIIMDVPFDIVDYRVGDLVTLYTDAPLKGPSDALALPSPK